MYAITRRVALATILATGVASGALAQEKKPLLVAEPTHGIGYLPLYVAIANGYFTEQGIEVKVITIDSGSGHTNAVLTGQAFAFIGGPEHNAFAKLKGAELRAVVNVVDRGNVYFVARKGLEPKPGESMADYFKGKKIGVGQYSGTPNSITRYLMKKYNLDVKTDVTLIETSTAAVIATVKTGAAEIGNVSEPLISRGIKEGLWGEPFLSVPADLGPYAYSTLNVRLDSIEKDPDSVQKFVNGVVKGLKFTYAHPDEATKVAKKEFPTMSEEDLKATLDRTFKDQLWSKDGSISQASWDTGSSVVRDAGILKQDVKYDEIIDNRFLKAVKAEAVK
ncbi:MAG: transporter periplasmic protein [Hyphomicrobiales bacterium]|nr:transporter periplasmic protein [Hyphomicrobiales bacterium]